MDEGRLRVLGIMAAILAGLHMQTADDLFGTPQGSPRTDKLIAASIQWAVLIMKKIDALCRMKSAVRRTAWPLRDQSILSVLRRARIALRSASPVNPCPAALVLAAYNAAPRFASVTPPGLRGLTAALCAQTPCLSKEQKNGCYFNATKRTGAEPMTTTNTKLELNWENLLTEAVTKPGKILAAYSLFHNYSLANAMLALIQCEMHGIQPGPINTFPGWKALGRHVIKGQKAISLVMPITCKKRDEENHQAADAADKHDSRESEYFTGFVFRPNWFVLSQTEGNDVAAATAPNWNAERALSALGITRVEFATMNGNAQGYAAPGKQIAINPVAALPHKTMFHELAHVVLGHTEEGQLSDDEQTPRSLREVEAESVALLCCASLGLEGEEFARGYIQNWLGGASIPEKSAQKIFATAAAILKAGQEKPQQKGEENAVAEEE
jgi:hypothetical protein